MLEDTKLSHEENADYYLKIDWRKENKNNLFRNYLKEENDSVKSAYLSAILYRYWDNIYKLYKKSPCVATPEDCYSWLLDAALYTLEKHKWEDPTSSIYQDPCGPDKVMNRMIKSFRLLYYEKTNAQKRKSSFANISTEYLTEVLEKEPIADSEVFVRDIEDPVYSLVKENFLKKNYFLCFLVFFISFYDDLNVIKEGKNVFNLKRLNHYMRNITEDQCKLFSNIFSLNLEETKIAAKSCKCLSKNKVEKAINRNFNIIRNDQNFKINN